MSLPGFRLRPPRPDAGRLIAILTGRAEGPVPLVEYLVDDAVMRPVVTGLLGRSWSPCGPERGARDAYLDNLIAFWHRLGYDAVRFELGLPFAVKKRAAPDPTAASGRRDWSDEHGGLIRSRADFERYPWPRVEDFDFGPFEYLGRHLPEGFGLIAGHAGGIFEHLSWIMSLEGLAFALLEDPPLVESVALRVGGLMTAFYARLLEVPGLVAIFPGDDMGFRGGTLVSPGHLRRYVLPWHRRFAAMARERGLPYFLHCCGNIRAIMGDLIDGVGIDGKHSYEDTISPAESFQALYGDRIAVLGGVDLNILSLGPEEAIRARVRRLIEVCGGRGRFAIGSGNSIPSYVSAFHYLAMVDEALAAAGR